MNPTTDLKTRISLPAARLAIAASAAALLLLALLHVLSPEFGPSWRMVSEYALGHYGWVLSLMFLAWAVGTWALAVAIWSQVTTRGGTIGLWLLMVAGLGEALAAVFDITHDVMHNVAGLLGIGALPIAAVLISVSLSRTEAWSSAKRALLWSAHLTWISVVLLIGSLVVMTMQFAQVYGGQLPQQAPAALPAGVVGLDGWADRFLVVAFCAWVITIAWQAVRIAQHGLRRPATDPLGDHVSAY